jgi:hypothetical protein
MSQKVISKQVLHPLIDCQSVIHLLNVDLYMRNKFLSMQISRDESYSKFSSRVIFSGVILELYSKLKKHSFEKNHFQV